MKKTIYYFKLLLILTAIAATVSSCSEDIGNYDYKDIPEIEIEGISSSLTTLSLQQLSVVVELKGLQPDEHRYEYEWLAIKQFAPDNANEPLEEVIATTKDLNEVITLAPGAYKLIYTVTDKQLEVFYQKQIDLSVITTTSEGWVVLSSENGNVRLDMVSNVLGEEIHTKDILADSDIPLKKGPISLIALSPDNKDDMSAIRQVDPLSPFYLLTEEGTTRLHKTAFKWEEEYLFKYEMGDVSSVKPSHISAAGAYRMVTSDAGIFTSDYSTGPTGLFGSPSNFTRGEDNKKQFIKVAPYVGANIANPMQIVPIFMFYDLDNKRFSYHPTDGYLELTGSTVPVGCFEMTDGEAGGNAFSFPQGYDFVYMENSGRVASTSMWGTPNSITYTILENDGVHHLYGIGLDDYYMALMGMVAYTKVSYANLVNCTGIANAKHFAFSPLNNQFFYAIENKVYRVNFDEDKPSAELQFELEGEITLLKFYLYKDAENKNRSNNLIVGSDKGGVDGGELRVYNAENNLEQLTDPEVYLSGFAKVVDVIYKEK